MSDSNMIYMIGYQVSNPTKCHTGDKLNWLEENFLKITCGLCNIYAMNVLYTLAWLMNHSISNESLMEIT